MPPANPLDALKQINVPTMFAVREGLRRAANDDRVKGLIVHVGSAPISPAVGDELAGLIRRFSQAKPTIAYAESFGEFSSAIFAYKVAAAAIEVWLQNSGVLAIGGVHLDITLLKGLLNKVGVQPQFGQRYEYKTAADRFSADEVTSANREMTQRIGQSLIDEAVASIAADRELSVEAVWQVVNAGQVTSAEALAAGFIDQLGYRDQVYSNALEQWQAEPEQLIYLHRYAERDVITAKIPNPRKSVLGVVEVRGGIVTGRGSGRTFGTAVAASDLVCDHLRTALRDERIKGVLLYVDSPGGSYIGSDAIRRAVLKVRESGRPVVAVMGNVAASGGYFAAMPATEIIAAPSTLTGSIGVLAGKMVTAGLYEKLGLKREGISIGERAAMLWPGHEFTEDDWALFNAELDRIYVDFTTKAAADRGLPLEQLEPLARGRVWTGADAKERKLVDHLGGMDLGIERLCELAGLVRDEVQLKSCGHLGFLERFRPAKNSESTSGAGIDLASSIGLIRLAEIFGSTSFESGGMSASTMASFAGMDAWFEAIANELGLSAPGVLSMPVLPRIEG